MFPDAGLQGMTTISVSGAMTWDGGDGATITVDFGDGTQMTASAEGGTLEHVYNTASTFTIRLTLTDALGRASTGQGTVTIKSLTGRWNLGTTGSFFILTQSGSSVTGTFTAANGEGSGVVTGSTRPQPWLGRAGVTGVVGLMLSVTPTGPGVPSSYSGSAFNGGDQINGTFVSGNAINVKLTRQ